MSVANLFVSKLRGFDENSGSPDIIPQNDVAQVVEDKKQEDTGMSQSTKSTLKGAELGMKSGNISGALTSAGLYNMLGAGAFTPAGAAMMGGGMLLNALDQKNQADYANSVARYNAQEQAKNAVTAGLFRMMGNNYSTVG